MSKPTCISLFSGGGGLDLGLEAAGFQTLVATDIDEHSCISLEKNKEAASRRGSIFLQDAQIIRRDIRQISGATLLTLAGLSVGELDLLAGGPPCQAFSIFGKRRGTSDERGQLVFHYLRILREVRPKAFLFENVFGLLTIENGRVLKELKAALSEPAFGLKYKITVHRVNAADTGAPQFRDRVFIFGSVEGCDVDAVETYFTSPENAALEGKLRWRTVSDALQGLPDQKTPGWHNHIGRQHSERIIDRYRGMSPGQRDHFTRINRLDLQRPSYTIIVGSDAGGGKGHVHPYYPREVTPRESARMQCFPDWWWFSGTSRHPIRQIGNAVPTLLGYAVGATLLRSIFKICPTSYIEAIESLGQRHLFSDEDLKFLERTSRFDQQDPLKLAI